MSTRTTTAWLAALGVLATGWWLLAPTAVGGRASYVVTHGVSMQPRFHTGDLAVVYPARTYRDGDVAAYRSEVLRTTVLHRIIGTSPSGYVFKGDNNGWIDPETPERQQIVGRLVIRVPQGGVVLGWLRRPITTGLLSIALLTAGTAGVAQRRRRKRRRTRAERASMAFSFLNAGPPSRRIGAAVAGTAAALFAALAAATFLVPGVSEYAEQVPWTTTISYDYGAHVPSSLVYPDGQIHAGQKVFRRLVDRLTIRATWSLQTRASRQVQGTGGLEAVVQSPAGWTHSVELAPPRAISGDRAVLTGTLNLAALDAVVARANGITGIPSDHYTVLVRPVVQLGGTMAGLPLTGAGGPQPGLTLAVTPDTVSPTSGTDPAASTPASSNGRPPGAGQAQASDNWLAPVVTTHSTVLLRRGPATWAVVGHRLPVATLRWIGVPGAALCLLAAVLLLLLPWAEKDPCTRQLRRHRGSIVSISGLHLAAAGNIVELTSMSALVEVARRYDRLILRQADSTGLYLVGDETGLYRYQCPHRRDHGGKRQHIAARPMRSDVATRSA